MNVAQLVEQAVSLLKNKKNACAQLDAEVILGFCLGLNRTEIYLHPERNVSAELAHTYWELVERRMKDEPVAYITKEREFWSLPFYVSPDVLIPRPETEFLIEKVLSIADISLAEQYGCLDLCCGSGVIAIVLARECDVNVDALDVSAKALEVMKINVERHDVQSQVGAIESNLFEAIPKEKEYGLIVTNPPYVKSGDILSQLEPDVVNFEPLLALDGGNDGLTLIRIIAEEALNHLVPGGYLFMEFGHDHGQEGKDIFLSARDNERYFDSVEIFKDYSGKDRVLCAQANVRKG